jgi:hypothetical protein
VRHTEGVRVSIEVEAGDRSEADPLVYLGPRLAGEDFDGVAERYEFTCEMTGVDTLTTATGVASVDQEGDAETSRLGRLRHDPLGNRRWCLRALFLVAPEQKARHGGPTKEST